MFDRKRDFSEDHGPTRFSLLYLCADGVAAFQALYIANSATPKAIAVIQPGHGFGGNWTDYTNPDRLFAKSVFQNPNGQPELLLYGGIGEVDYYKEPCWPTFQSRICFLDKAGGGGIGVWAKHGRSSKVRAD